MLKKLLRPPGPGEVDYRSLTRLLLNTVAIQLVVSLIRVTTTYRTIELGLSPILLGAISAAFALLPIFFAVKVGRLIDRGRDAEAMWVGSALIIASSVGFWLATGPISLLISSSLLGIGHICIMASQQILCVRYAGNDRYALDQVFGSYMVAGALGSAAGPGIVGWFGGDAHVPPTHLLYLVGVGAAVFVMLNSLTFRPGPDRDRKADPDNEVPVRTLLAIPGVYAILLLSVVSNSAQELIVVYLPYLGPERGVSVNAVGALLSIRAAASVLSRILYAPIIRRVGRQELMLGTTVAAACAFVVLAIPAPFAVSAVAVAIIGFALGTSTTLSLTGMIDLVGNKGRGTGNTLRIMGNRIGQMAMPGLAGLLAAASGVGGVFVILAINLAAAAGMVHFGKKR